MQFVTLDKPKQLNKLNHLIALIYETQGSVPSCASNQNCRSRLAVTAKMRFLSPDFDKQQCDA